MIRRRKKIFTISSIFFFFFTRYSTRTSPSEVVCIRCGDRLEIQTSVYVRFQSPLLNYHRNRRVGRELPSRKKEGRKNKKFTEINRVGDQNFVIIDASTPLSDSDTTIRFKWFVRGREKEKVKTNWIYIFQTAENKKITCFSTRSRFLIRLLFHRPYVRYTSYRT